MIKNLNQLRRTLREGTQLEILDHCRPECIGQIALFGLAFFGYKVVHDAPEHKNLCHNTPFCHWHYYLYKKVPAVFRP